MKTVRRFAFALLFFIPLLATAPAYAQARVTDSGNGQVTLVAADGTTFTVSGQVNADGTVTLTPAGSPPITIPVALAGQLATALSAPSPTAVSEAIANVVADNAAVFSANNGLLAGIAAVASAASPANGDAVARGVLSGASEIGALATIPSIATQIVAGVTGAGASISPQTRGIVNDIVASGGNPAGDNGGGGGEGGDVTGSQENPATAASEAEPGAPASPT